MNDKVGKRYILDDGCILQMVGETFSFIDKSGQSSPLRLTESHKTILNRLLRSRNEKCSYDELYILYGKQDPKPSAPSSGSNGNLYTMKYEPDDLCRSSGSYFCYSNYVSVNAIVANSQIFFAGRDCAFCPATIFLFDNRNEGSSKH